MIMKKVLFLLPVLLFCKEGNITESKCLLNKSEMKCNYYVALKGDLKKRDFCKKYADYLFKTKVYGRASWYYLLSKEPKKAIKSAQEAIKMGENYAYEYLADSYLIEGDFNKAKENYEKFRKSVKDTKFFTDKNFKVLNRLYKNFDKKRAEDFLK